MRHGGSSFKRFCVVLGSPPWSKYASQVTSAFSYDDFQHRNHDLRHCFVSIHSCCYFVRTFSRDVVGNGVFRGGFFGAFSLFCLARKMHGRA